MRLAEELTGAKVKMAPEAFEDLIRKTFEELYSGMTTEQLARRPTDGLRFCGIIRQRAKGPLLAEDVIMGTLENLRKRSRLKAIG